MAPVPLPARVALRPAVPADAPALWAIHSSAIRHLAAEAYIPAQIEAWCARASPAGLAEPIVAGRVIVAVDDGRPCGYGEVACDEGVIRAVYVDPDFAGRGVGRRIVDALEHLARARGVPMLSLDATRNAVPFYRALGYREQGRSHHPLPHGQVLDCEVMAKPLR